VDNELKVAIAGASFTDRLVDFAVANHIRFARLSNQKYAEALKILESGDSEISGIISTMKKGVRTASIMSSVRVVMERVHAQLLQFVQETADDVAYLSATIEAQIFETQSEQRKVSKHPTVEPTKIDVMTQLRQIPLQGATLQNWFNELARADVMRAERHLRQSFIERRPSASILNGLLGSYTLASKNHQAVRSITKRALRSLITSAVSHAVAVGQNAVRLANASRVQREVWISVLDSKTSDFCRDHAGHTWPLGKGPWAPAHINCRSIKIVLFYREKLPSGLSWYDWLRNQDEETQREALGASRYDLWKRGGVQPERFTDAEGERYNLDELRQRLPKAFRRLKSDNSSVAKP
jgi:hypothetical protein